MQDATGRDPSPAQDVVQLIPALRAFARTFYRDPSDADDLVQVTLTRALGAIDQFTPGTSMKSWLFTIMRNSFYSKVKVDSRETTGREDCVSIRPACDPTQEWSVRGREIAEAIARLPPQHREVIMLIGVIGVSYEEAAEVCGCAMGTIKSRLNRARARLLQELGETSPDTAWEQHQNHPVDSIAEKSH